MSRVRVHNFSISLDGFATGEGQALDTPFGHAGHRLHKWMIATRFGREVLGESGGTEGVDHVLADRPGPGIGAEIMGRASSALRAGRTTRKVTLPAIGDTAIPPERRCYATRFFDPRGARDRAITNGAEFWTALPFLDVALLPERSLCVNCPVF